MLRYETLILAHPQLTADENSFIEGYFDNLMSQFKGKLLAFDKWGKYHLSYSIKKHSYGIYLLARYDVPENKVTELFKELNTFFQIKCNDIVIRYVTVKLDANAPLIYKYPEPISAVKTGNLDSFIKENKMEGFLGDVSKKPNPSTNQDAITSQEEN